MIHRLLLIAGFAGAGMALLALPGCTTTQARSEKLSREAATAAEAKKFKVGKTNADIKIDEITRLQGKDASALVVRVVNRGNKPQVMVPIGVDLYDKSKASIYTNRVDGLDAALNNLPVVPPGESWWLNNQVPAEKAARTRVRVGTTRTAAPADLPELSVTPLKLGEDVGVITGKGKVTNESKVDQLRLTIFAVALKGDRVVAAGRSVIDRVPATGKKTQKFSIYFTGDPRGAKLHVFAPPSTLGGA